MRFAGRLKRVPASPWRIEDIDLDDGKAGAHHVQCNYYEDGIQPLCNQRRVIPHVAAFPGGCTVVRSSSTGSWAQGSSWLALPLTDDFLKRTSSHLQTGRTRWAQGPRTGNHGPQLAAFRSLLDLDVMRSPTMRSRPNCSDSSGRRFPDAATSCSGIFYYRARSNVIQGLAIQADRGRRKSPGRVSSEVDRQSCPAPGCSKVGMTTTWSAVLVSAERSAEGLKVFVVT